MALNFSTYELSGGCFNAAMIIGGLMFESVVDYRYMGLFLGQLLGCLIARLLVWQLWGEGEKNEDGTAIKMLMKE